MAHPQYVKKYVTKYKNLFTPVSAPVSSTIPAYPIAESSDGLNFDAVKAHLTATVAGLQSEAPRGAWFFGMACSFLDVLSWGTFYDKIVVRDKKKMSVWKKIRSIFTKNVQCITTMDDYVKFLKKYFFVANPRYATCYSNLTGSSSDKFARKIYQTLRCGVLHSFSMKQSMDSWDKGYSILLARYCDFKDSANHHLEIVDLFMDDTGNSIESVIFVAEEMAIDIEKCVNHLIRLAESTEPQLKQNFIDLYKNKPPLGFLDIDLV